MSNSVDTSIDPKMPASRSARAAETRRRKAAKTREWRATRAAVGCPEARKVDAAVSEAVAFCTRDVFLVTAAGSAFIDLRRMLRVATLVLVRQGYDRELAKSAIQERLRPRDLHESSIVPSIHMHEEGFQPAPRRGGDETWDDADIRTMKLAAAPLK